MGQADTLRSQSVPCRFIDIDNQSIQSDLPLARFELSRQSTKKTVNNNLSFHPDHTVVRAGHPEIGNICRSSWENLFIGCLDMSVCPDYCRNAGVEKSSDAHFFRGCLGVHIDQDDFDRRLESG